MTKLTKYQISERDKVCATLREGMEALQAAVDTFNELRTAAWAELSAALETYNNSVQNAWEDLEPVIGTYNGEAIPTARDWKDGIVGEIDEYISNRSDKWAESDKGQSVSAWKDSFDEVDLAECGLEMPEPIEIDEPDELSLDVEDATELLEQIAEAAE